MKDSLNFAARYLAETARIAGRIEPWAVEALAQRLSERRGGRLFFLGVGGSAANASHAVNDFRKLCGFEAYAPTDNVAELTARTNDEGWGTVFVEWLKGSRLGENDTLFVLSVGGGAAAVSHNLVLAIDHAREVGAAVLAIVGRPDGHAARYADICLVVPTDGAQLTPHAEEFQSIVLHLLVSHPLLKRKDARWESLTSR